MDVDKKIEFDALLKEYTAASEVRAATENQLVQDKIAQSNIVEKIALCIAPIKRLFYLDDEYSIVVSKEGNHFLRLARKKGEVAK